MPIASYQHGKLVRDAQLAGVTVADLAKALAYQDGKLADYDAGETYGFTVRAEELLGVAIQYAEQRTRR
jgi:hypothetical protein